jgi:hypothetical protein
MPEFPPGGTLVSAVALTISEIVVAIVPGTGGSGAVNVDDPTAGASLNCIVRAMLDITSGAAGTNPVVKAYRNNAGAQTVGSAKSGAPTALLPAAGYTQTQAVSTSASGVGGQFQDAANNVPSAGYIVTVTMTAGTGTANGVVSANDGQ